MEQNRKLGILAILGVVLISGVAYISKDIIVDYLNPIVVVALQLIIMAGLLTVYNFARKISFAVEKKDIWMIVLSGLFGTTFFNLFSVMSIRYIGGTVSSLLFGLAAVLSLVIEFVFYRRKRTVLSIVSVALSLVGVYILMGLNPAELLETNLIGYFLSLLSIIAWVLFCFFSDRVSSACEKTVVLNYQALVGVMTTMPFLFVYPVARSSLTNPIVIINMLVLGVLNATVAYFLCIYAIRHIGLTFSNLLMNFFPVITVLVTFLIYGTMPSLNQMIGGVVILISVLILNRDQKNLIEVET
ncbi:DMT family transporter [Eubacteriaceae bacterium ES3]|nr:DMT family transporter [Eubacteriaceae bacterium ES3]